MSGADDDWFEKALRQSDEETDSDRDDASGDGTDEIDDTETDDIETNATSADDIGTNATSADDIETDDIDNRTNTADNDGGAATDTETDTPATGGSESVETTDSGSVETSDSFGGDHSTSNGDPFGGGQSDGAFGNGHSTDDSDGDLFDGAGDSFDSIGGGADGDPSDDAALGGANDADGDPFGGTQTSGDTDGSSGDLSAGSDDPFGGVQSASSTEPAGGTDRDSSGGQTDDAGGDPFGGTQMDDSGGTSPGVAGGDDPFGGAQSAPGGDDDTPFGEGFDEAMGGGMGGGVGGGGTEFDEEEFESEIERIDVGIEGLDDMILGGVPIRSLMTVIGSAGTGKTTFGLQFLDQAMRTGGSGVYITLEETEEAIISTAEEKGWPFEQYVEDDQLIVVAMDPIEMANSLDSIRGDISRLVNDFGADRLVLDSVSLLEMMYDHPAKRRSEVFDFARSLKRAGVTTMLTSEANADNSYQSRHGLVEYLVDAVFVLQYVRPNDFQETRLAVEIQKIRDANHSRETKPYDITDNGMSVYRQANIF